MESELFMVHSDLHRVCQRPLALIFSNLVSFRIINNQVSNIPELR